MDKRLTVPKQCLLFGQKLYESKHSVAYTAIYAFSLLLASIFLLEVFFSLAPHRAIFSIERCNLFNGAKNQTVSRDCSLIFRSLQSYLDGFSLVCCTTKPRCAECIYGDIGLALTPQPEGFFFVVLEKLFLKIFADSQMIAKQK